MLVSVTVGTLIYSGVHLVFLGCKYVFVQECSVQRSEDGTNPVYLRRK